ncbi:MAG: hypothetical protein GQ582_00260 [Methyloprofundus sp.]|nr:hypothetical protein [Methyloprofundus sp.]
MSSHIELFTQIRHLFCDALDESLKLVSNDKVLLDLLLGSGVATGLTTADIQAITAIAKNSQANLNQMALNEASAVLRSDTSLDLLDIALEIDVIMELLETSLIPFFAPVFNNISAEEGEEQARLIILAVLPAMFNMGALSVLRRQQPAAYAFMRAIGVVGENLELVEWDAVARLLPHGDGDWIPTIFLQTESDALRLSNTVFQLIAIAAGVLSEKLPGWMADTPCGRVSDPELFVRYGWDEAPEERGDDRTQVAKRTLSLKLQGDFGDGVVSGIILSTAFVPVIDGGPGLLLSLQGDLDVSPNPRVHLKYGPAEAASIFIPWDDADKDIAIFGGEFQGVSLTIAAGKKALIIGDATGSHIALGGFGGGMSLKPDGLLFYLDINEGLLRIKAGDGDAFLATILADTDISAPFKLSLLYSPNEGLRVAGGAGFHINVATQTQLGGISLQGIELGIAASDVNNGLAKLSAGAQIGAEFGPFQAAIDGIGFSLDIGTKAPNGGLPNLSLIHASAGFKAPKGAGFLINSSFIRGGGYLTLDVAKGEYTGALDFACSKISLKALGLLNTKLTDIEAGWSLLFALYFEFGPVPIGFGFDLTGAGGLLGINHRMDTDVLRENLRSGVLDDVLFPKNPIANATKIFRTLRQVFPVQDERYLFGPVFQFRQGGKAEIALLRVGLILEFCRGGGGNTRLIMIGQAKIRAPSKQAPLVILNIDVLGEIDFQAHYTLIAIDAQLYDSRIASFNITGTWVARFITGSNPFMLYAAGGFHPQYALPAQFSFGTIDRCGFSMTKGPARITLEAYYAFTSNALMAGAELEIVAKKWGFTASLGLGFDALVVFTPRFFFIVEIRAHATIKKGSRTIAGATFTGQLSGPGRWQAKGRIRIKLWLFSKTLSFNKSWGEDPQDQLPFVDASDLLEQELSRDENWAAVALNTQVASVSLRKLDEGEFVLSPGSEISFRQKALPFNLELSKIGAARISGESSFAVTSVCIAGKESLTTSSVITEPFARGQYQDLSDDEKMTAPAFEPMQCGVTLRSIHATVQLGGHARREQDYELKELHRETENKRLPRIGLDLQLALARLKTHPQARLNPDLYPEIWSGDPVPPNIQVNERGYTVVDADTLSSHIAVTDNFSQARHQAQQTALETGGLLVETHLVY